MTAEHFDQILSELTNKAPFRVFTVETQGGRRFEVDHPKALIFREGIAVFLAPGGIPIVFDHENVNQFVIAPANQSY